MPHEKPSPGNAEQDVIVFDFFGLFVSDPYRRFFKERLGEDFAETKDRLCQPADRGEIPYEAFLEQAGALFAMDPKEVRRLATDYAQANPEMFSLALRCKDVRPTYLLSNCMIGMIEELAPSIDVPSHFDGMFLSCEAHLIKPDRSFFEYLLRSLSLPPSKVHFYDDNRRNVEMAASLGIDATLFQDVPSCEADLKSKGLL